MTTTLPLQLSKIVLVSHAAVSLRVDIVWSGHQILLERRIVPMKQRNKPRKQTTVKP